MPLAVLTNCVHELLVLYRFGGLVTDVLDATKKLANNDEGTAFTVSLECKVFLKEMFI